MPRASPTARAGTCSSSTPSRNRHAMTLPSRLLTAIAALVLLPTSSAQDAVTFCASAASLPMSAEYGAPRGYEVEIARALAERLGAEARFTWLGSEEAFEEAVRAGRCDAALGVIVDPGPMADPPDLTGLALTRPYYQTGYLLVRRPEAPPVRSFDEVPDTRIGVEGESVVTYTLRQRGQPVHVLFDRDAVIEAVADGRAVYGYLWGPVTAWSLRERDDVVVAAEFESPDRWHFALAVPAGDTALRTELDAAIAALDADGTLERLITGYGLPYSPGTE